MIELIKLKKSFKNFNVLKSINLKLSEGECVALIGPNACGKTTMIKSILGLVMPDKGEILYNGVSVLKEFNFRKEIGYMPQVGRYPENMTVGQIFKMINGIRQDKVEIDMELYEKFKIDTILNKKMHTLSGGTVQKVSASLAFMFNPKVLILDEPTAGLDPLASEILKDKILMEKSKGKLILITSHLLSELDEMVSQIVLMQDGMIIFHKDVLQLVNETGEQKISKAIVHYLKNNINE